MKIAISGSGGFIGSNLCALLQQYQNNYEIIPVDIVTGIDLSDSADCAGITKFDVFVHLANLTYVPASYQNPEKFYRINYLTTLNALELCRKYNAKLIYISSYVYGAPQYLPVDENHPVRPFNPYAQSKVICETLCDGYFRDFHIPVIILRPFNIYGIGQKGNLIIPEIIRQLKEHRTIISLRDPNPKRDYINVSDVVHAIKACIDFNNLAIRRYNLCYGKSYSVQELTEIINSHLNKKVEFTFSQSDRPNEVDDTVGTTEKIRRELNWSPKIDLKTGIAGIIEYEKL